MSLCKTNDPWGGAILNNLNKCLQNKDTYEVSKASHLPPPPTLNPSPFDRFRQEEF